MYTGSCFCSHSRWGGLCPWSPAEAELRGQGPRQAGAAGNAAQGLAPHGSLSQRKPRRKSAEKRACSVTETGRNGTFSGSLFKHRNREGISQVI